MVGIAAYIRPMLMRDLPVVLEIEEANNSYPWYRADFIEFMESKMNYGVVAEYREKIVGFMLYQLIPTKRQSVQSVIMELSVDPELQRRGIGTHLADWLLEGAIASNWDRITYYVLESNLPAQLFLRSCEFTAVKVHKDFYDDSDEDVYEMEVNLLLQRRMLSGSGLTKASELP